MNARIMKSKSPVRKDHHFMNQNKDPKTSIFKGPVNKEFFTKVEKCISICYDNWYSGEWDRDHNSGTG